MCVKGQGHSLTLVKGHSDFEFKTCFSQKQLGHLEPKIFYTNELGHLTNMTPMPIYGKNLKKSSSPEAIDR